MIHVVVGILRNARNEILIAKRLSHQYGAGLWEFPGGKVGAGEAPYFALQREFNEEIGIQILAADPLLQVKHSYEDRIVLLDTWLIDSFEGEPHGAEGQEVRWVKHEDLPLYTFPAGNNQIIKLLTSSNAF